jgi:hypothetical protein
MTRILPYCFIIILSCSPNRKFDDKRNGRDSTSALVSKIDVRTTTNLYPGMRLEVTDSATLEAIGKLCEYEFANKRQNEIEVYPLARLVKTDEQGMTLEYVYSNSRRGVSDAFEMSYTYIIIPNAGKIALNVEYRLPHPDVQTHVFTFSAWRREEYKLFAAKVTFTSLSRDSARASVMGVAPSKWCRGFNVNPADSAYMMVGTKRVSLRDTVVNGEFSFLRRLVKD